jgi:hypothetical protein
MKTIILFSSDFKDSKSIDYAYKNEYDVALTFSDFIPDCPQINIFLNFMKNYV